jgi:16S rRNA (uracil1498-N3)-methyltransferase
MSDRYFVEVPIDGPRARIAGSEAHHLAHVMRAKPGALVTLFDGSGAEFAARVENVGRAEVELAVLARNEMDRELPVSITLGVALPKGDRQRWLVEKATELGVARLVPLEAERACDRASDAMIERLRRAVIEASKQCGRNRLMQIHAPESLRDFLAASSPRALRLLAHPGAMPLARAIDEPTSAGPILDVILAIGPEGGFTADEVEAAGGHGWRVVGFGPTILRVETAALAIAAAVAARLGPRRDQ